MFRARRFGVGVCLVLMAGILLAQQARPKFEVASIKPVQSEAHNGAVVMREFSKGRVSVEAVPYTLIEESFGVRNDQMAGGPEWIHTDYYAVTAKADHPAGASEMWLMMETLLENRFHLKTHREKRQMPVYKLSLANGGLKVRERPCASWAERTPSPPPAGGATFALPCGRLIAYMIDRGAGSEFVGGKIPMSSLAEFLTRQLRHPVLDETGYKGTFDIDVKVSNDEIWGRVSTDPDPSGLPTVSGAMRELGIRLELVKGPVEMLVIDSISRPDRN
ncbi:MAG TPA: TIGR03435 family protein [Bryobacteraceae bacterium]|nr:TIGR03435 family protein [Bryobacteraceae bacterium]